MTDIAGAYRTTVDARRSNGIWSRHPGTLSRLTSRSVVISTEALPLPVRVTGAAMIVWLALGESRTTSELIDHAATLCGVPSESIRTAALDALRELIALGAVVQR